MICYLVRHGQDDASIRGGWSNHGLTAFGKEQVNKLTNEIKEKQISIKKIYSSDLERAKETAYIISDSLNVPVILTEDFREVNNGDLAGMKNDIANKKYPGLFWSSLDFNECYPNGESPEKFYNRVKKAWIDFKRNIEGNTMLVTHGGVIEVILCIENEIAYSNKKKQFSTPNAELISITV